MQLYEKYVLESIEEIAQYNYGSEILDKKKYMSRTLVRIRMMYIILAAIAFLICISAPDMFSDTLSYLVFFGLTFLPVSLFFWLYVLIAHKINLVGALYSRFNKLVRSLVWGAMYLTLALLFWSLLWYIGFGIYLFFIVSNAEMLHSSLKKNADKPITEIIKDEIQPIEKYNWVKKFSIGLVALVVVIAGVSVYNSIPFETEFIYTEVSDGYAIDEYKHGINDDNYNITIPAKYNGLSVVAINESAFKNNKKIKEVVIPDTVKLIDSAAFKNCKELEKVTLGSSVEIINGAAFMDCESLRSITIPNTVTHLGGESFMNCTSLSHVELSKKLTEIRGDTFKNCESLKSVDIPEGVTRIGGHAFFGCISLSHVYVPDSLETIGSSAFRCCYELKEITLPPITVVNERAFKESPTTIRRKGYSSGNIGDWE